MIFKTLLEEFRLLNIETIIIQCKHYNQSWYFFSIGNNSVFAAVLQS